MFREEQLNQQNYRLKNQISDLRNVLDMNKDFLVMLSKQDLSKDKGRGLLFKIVTKLTEQSNQALLSNLELIQEKQVLRGEIYRLNMLLDDVQGRFKREMERNQNLESPNTHKVIVQEQFYTMNNELLASQEQKIQLQGQIRHWKGEFSSLQSQITQRFNQTIQTLRPHTPPKRFQMTRKYQSNNTSLKSQHITLLQKQIVRLKRYIEEIENRLLVFIKAYNYEDKLIEDKESHVKTSHLLDGKLDMEIKLIKYAVNQIKVEEKGEDFVMTLKEYFRNQKKGRRSGREAKSWPKYKEFRLQTEGNSDQLDNLNARLY